MVAILRMRQEEAHGALQERLNDPLRPLGVGQVGQLGHLRWNGVPERSEDGHAAREAGVAFEGSCEVRQLFFQGEPLCLGRGRGRFVQERDQLIGTVVPLVGAVECSQHRQPEPATVDARANLSRPLARKG